MIPSLRILSSKSCIVFYSLFKFLIIAHNKNEQDDQRQNIGNVNARPGGEFYALAGVGFCQEVFPAPAVSAGTEQQIDHAAQGQEVVGNNEVLEILNRGASAHRLETGPDVEAEYAGQGQEDNRNSIDQDGFFTGCAEQIHGKADDIFKYGNNRGLGGKRHEDEEQNTENPSADHLVEDVGQSDEHQSGSLSGIDAECKAGRENNQSCEKSNQCVQKADIDGFPCQGVVFTDVAAENRHRTDAEAQGKERLSHCGENRVADAIFCKSGKIGNQIKALFQIPCLQTLSES